MKLRATLAACVLAVAACGPQIYQMVSLPSAPGAEATLKAKVKRATHLTTVQLTIAKLRPPAEVADGATAYVAWYRENAKKEWKRIAAIEYDAHARTGELNASTPEVAFDFEVSAETSDDVDAPSDALLFTQRVEK